MRQHYVPKTYLNGWLSNNQNVYFYENKYKNKCEPRNPESILKLKHIYTVGYNEVIYLYGCTDVITDFYNKIIDILNERQVYAKINNENIIGDDNFVFQLQRLDEWLFFDSSNNIPVRSRPIRNQIKEIKSYVIENRFSEKFENSWQNDFNNLIEELSYNRMSQEGFRIVSQDSINKVLYFTIISMMRNPKFDFFGLLTVTFDVTENAFITPGTDTQEASIIRKVINHMKKASWLTQIYAALFTNYTGIIRNPIYNQINQIIQNGNYKIMLFSANELSFITSDNCAFISDKIDNYRMYYFPLSYKYLLAIGMMENSLINEIDCRGFSKNEVKKFNKIIYKNAYHSIVSCDDDVIRKGMNVKWIRIFRLFIIIKDWVISFKKE